LSSSSTTSILDAEAGEAADGDVLLEPGHLLGHQVLDPALGVADVGLIEEYLEDEEDYLPEMSEDEFLGRTDEEEGR